MIVALAALVGAAPAAAHLPYKTKNDTLREQLRVQRLNLAHARYVCKQGANEHKRWACHASRGWLREEVGDTWLFLNPPRPDPPSVYVIARDQAFSLGVSYDVWHYCSVPLISRENANPPESWDPENWNDQGSDAYGLGQALPPSKMMPWGSDYMTNPATQIRWMDAYVDKYGGWCGANSYQLRNGYY